MKLTDIQDKMNDNLARSQSNITFASDLLDMKISLNGLEISSSLLFVAEGSLDPSTSYIVNNTVTFK